MSLSRGSVRMLASAGLLAFVCAPAWGGATISDAFDGKQSERLLCPIQRFIGMSQGFI